MIIKVQDFNDALAAGKSVVVSAGDGLLLRAAPSINDGTPILAAMPHGAAFTLTGDKRVGFVEGTFNGQQGWAFAEFLGSAGLGPNESVATVISAEGLNLRSGPSLEAGVVTLMPNGASFATTGDSRLGFLAGTFNSQHGWAFGEYLDREDGPPPPPNGSFLEAMRNAGMTITQGPWNSFSHSQCACYDFGIAEGTPIFPIAGGEVIVSEGTNDQYRPNKIMIRTQELGDHLYAHLSRRDVNVGETVTTNTLIGLSGSENGPHLHFQLDRGFSPLGLTVTQTLMRQGFDVTQFPALDGATTSG